MNWYRFDWEDDMDSFILGIETSADTVEKELEAYKEQQPQRDHCCDDWAGWLEARGFKVDNILIEDTFTFPA